MLNWIYAGVLKGTSKKFAKNNYSKASYKTLRFTNDPEM